MLTFLGLFIQYGMFGAVALARIKTDSRNKLINSEIEGKLDILLN